MKKLVSISGVLCGISLIAAVSSTILETAFLPVFLNDLELFKIFQIIFWISIPIAIISLLIHSYLWDKVYR